MSHSCRDLVDALVLAEVLAGNETPRSRSGGEPIMRSVRTTYLTSKEFGIK